MPYTQTQVEALVATQSHYGCGAEKCAACYPIQYSCEWCVTLFASPIANGEVFTCPECDWVNNGDN